MISASEPMMWRWENSIGRFKIHCDFEPQHVRRLEEELQSLSHEISQTLEIETIGEPIHIVLFEKEFEYQRYLKHYFPSLPERRAIFIQDRGPGMLFGFWHSEIDTDIRHEVTHALLNDQQHGLPLWLDEGIAEYMEAPLAQRFAGHLYLSKCCLQFSDETPPDLQRLEQITSLSEFGDLEYQQSWAWIHFLLHRSPRTRQLLVSHLADLRSGKTTAPVSRKLWQCLQDPYSEFTEHFRAIHLGQLTRIHGDEHSSEPR
ncbi:MAG: hypothetical protein KDB03_23620 [Planctomycetales bacterium]|nr:hypothetical protein [Planctomycetales bacterium]